MNFVSFGSSHNYPKSLKRIKNEARAMGVFDTIMVCDETDLDPDFYEQHKDFMHTSPRGFGYWIWKPQIILQALHCSPDGKFVVYADCGSTLNPKAVKRLWEYTEYARNSPTHIMGFKLGFYEHNWTKKKTLDLFPKHFRYTFQNHATIMVIYNSPRSRKFIKEWLDICTADNYEYINDIHDDEPDLKDHRHDQSVYSLLSKKYNSFMIPDETYQMPFDVPISGTRIRE